MIHDTFSSHHFYEWQRMSDDAARLTWMVKWTTSTMMTISNLRSKHFHAVFFLSFFLSFLLSRSLNRQSTDCFAWAVSVSCTTIMTVFSSFLSCLHACLLLAFPTSVASPSCSTFYRMILGWLGWLGIWLKWL